MNFPRNLESMISGLVEGVFGRVFRSEVRPMELARKLAREMDEHRTASVSRVYAPNEYEVWLSPGDRARYEGVEEQLIDELCAYLLEHARSEELVLASHPRIDFHTDESLTLGEFGIQARLVRASDHDESPEQLDEHGQTMIYSSSRRTREPLEEARSRRAPRALLSMEGRRILVPPSGAVLGRSRECDIVLDDGGVSRRHMRIRPTPEGWVLEDLGSTNGVRLNDRPVQEPVVLALGDRIELGSTEIVFDLR
jgi:FhaA, N-terminal domain/FHA domain